MSHASHGYSQIGVNKDVNEDAYLIDAELGLFVVCDGVGGNVGGDEAAQLACRTIHDHLVNNRAELDKLAEQMDRDSAIKLLANAVRVANTRVHNRSKEEDSRKGMACTVVAVMTFKKHAVVAHAGDSRAYLIRRGEVVQLTEDHTALNYQLKTGQISAAEAKEMTGKKSPIIRALGHKEFLEIDTLFLELMSGDKFILASDGVCGAFNDGELLKYTDNLSEDQIPEHMVALAKERGSHDDCTAMILTIESVGAENDANLAQKVEVLRKIPLFHSLNYKEVVKILNIAEVRKYDEKDLMIKEGGTDANLYVLLSGEAEVVKKGDALATMRAGDFFGEMSLLDKAPRSADVRVTRKARALVVDRTKLVNLLTIEPAMGLKVVWMIARVLNLRLRNTSDELSFFKESIPDASESIPSLTEADLALLGEDDDLEYKLES